VRFQTNEAVAVQDPELVLRALETCLRDVSSEVARHGDQITLHGLGPSPRAVNYQDTTVLSVSAEDDKTIINADVSFQASSVLGDVSQDEVVREKLDQVFDQMRMQIDLESKRLAAAPASSSAADLPSTNGPFVVPAAASVSVTPAAVLEAAPLETSPLHRTEEPVERPMAAAPLRVPFEDWDDSASLVAMLRRDMQEDQFVPVDSNRRIWVIFAVIAFVLLAGGFYLLRFRNHAGVWPSAATVSQQPVTTPAAATPAGSETAAVTKSNEASTGSPLPPVAPPVASATPPAASAAPHAASATPPTASAAPAVAPAAPPVASAAPANSSAGAVSRVADPKVWLEQWAAAMRSRDAVAQASFYADPVSQYINRRNVSNAVLVQAKRADIGRRQGSWTFSANDVVVENKTPSEATVRLVKHYMVAAAPSQVSEIAVNTRMQLKVINGQWKITSEEELRAPARAAVNPIDR
jgi:hypothetical protein